MCSFIYLFISKSISFRCLLENINITLIAQNICITHPHTYLCVTVFVYLDVCVYASIGPILKCNPEARTTRIHEIMRETILSVASCGHSSTVRKTKVTEGSGTTCYVPLKQKHWSSGKKRNTSQRHTCGAKCTKNKCLTQMSVSH